MSSAECKKFWRIVNKNRGIQALGGKCAHCGGVFPDVVYDFHHLNPEEKSYSLSSIQTNGAKAWLLYRDELKKCCLLCANCHRAYHMGLFELENKQYFNENFYEWKLMNLPTIQTFEIDCSKDITKQLINLSLLEEKENLHICPICKKEKTPRAQMCIECSLKHQRKCERPSREMLKQLIRTQSFLSIGKQFGVSDNAIRKWCIQYDLPKRKTDINNYSDEQWELI